MVAGREVVAVEKMDLSDGEGEPAVGALVAPGKQQGAMLVMVARKAVGVEPPIVLVADTQLVYGPALWRGQPGLCLEHRAGGVGAGGRPGRVPPHRLDGG